MEKQLLEESTLRLAAVENEITTIQNQITNSSLPSCTDNDLAQMKMLVSKFPLSNLKTAQYLHATQLLVANLSEQLEHEKNLRRQQDRTIQQLQIVVQNLQKKTITPTVEQPVNTPLHTPSPTEPESTDTQRRLDELKPFKCLIMDLYDRIHSIDCKRDKKLIWRICSFSLMFDNAKAAELERQKGIDPHPKIPCNFQSPPFYTSTHGYRFHMKLYPYGCSPATGESASLVLTILPYGKQKERNLPSKSKKNKTLKLVTCNFIFCNLRCLSLLISRSALNFEHARTCSLALFSDAAHIPYLIMTSNDIILSWTLCL